MRILFNRRNQREFIKDVCKKLNISLRQLSILTKLKSYSVFKNYYNERYSLPIEVGDYLTKLSGISWRKFEIKDFLENNWGQRRGGRVGIRKMRKKHKRYISEWCRKGYLRANLAEKSTKEITIPKLNQGLAEFIGIVLGDGTLTKYFVRISLNAKNEMPYVGYVKSLCEELFSITPSIYKDPRNNTINLKIFSVRLCEFLHKKFNLSFGDKLISKASIPNIILDDKKLVLACIRGLIDSDGDVFKGKFVYLYSHNPILLKQVSEMGRKLGVFTTETNTSVGTRNHKNVVRYFELIGTSNLKNAVKFIEKIKNNQELYTDDSTEYFEKYKTIELPYTYVGS